MGSDLVIWISCKNVGRWSVLVGVGSWRWDIGGFCKSAEALEEGPVISGDLEYRVQFQYGANQNALGDLTYSE